MRRGVVLVKHEQLHDGCHGEGITVVKKNITTAVNGGAVVNILFVSSAGLLQAAASSKFPINTAVVQNHIQSYTRESV